MQAKKVGGIKAYRDIEEKVRTSIRPSVLAGKDWRERLAIRDRVIPEMVTHFPWCLDRFNLKSMFHFVLEQLLDSAKPKSRQEKLLRELISELPSLDGCDSVPDGSAEKLKGTDRHLLVLMCQPILSMIIRGERSYYWNEIIRAEKEGDNYVRSNNYYDTAPTDEKPSVPSAVHPAPVDLKSAPTRPVGERGQDACQAAYDLLMRGPQRFESGADILSPYISNPRAVEDVQVSWRGKVLSTCQIPWGWGQDIRSLVAENGQNEAEHVAWCVAIKLSFLIPDVHWPPQDYRLTRKMRVSRGAPSLATLNFKPHGISGTLAGGGWEEAFARFVKKEGVGEASLLVESALAQAMCAVFAWQDHTMSPDVLTQKQRFTMGKIISELDVSPTVSERIHIADASDFIGRHIDALHEMREAREAEDQEDMDLMLRNF